MFESAWTLPTLEFIQHHDTLFDKPQTDTATQPIDVNLPRTRQLSLFGDD
ncbi:MAG: hypothetical protein AAFV93_08240 [Chloroflexota bacterium]